MESTHKTGPDAGGDQWGRVEYSSYFRPPGLPGQVDALAGGTALHHRGHLPLDEYRSLSDHHGHEQWPQPPLPTPPSNSNPLHGFEAQRFPNLNYSRQLATRNTPAACRST